MEEEILFVDRVEIGGERAHDESARGVDAAIEIDAGDHRFEEVREQRFLFSPACFLFADTEEDDVAHVELARLVGETRRADEERLHLRERTFVEGRKAGEQQIADDEAEHGVAEEFERLVMTNGVVF